MTNADVIKMVKAELSEAIIVAAIRQAPRRAFVLGADGLLELKSAGVSDEVLFVMLDPTAPPRPVAPTPTPAPPVSAPVTVATPAPALAPTAASAPRAAAARVLTRTAFLIDLPATEVFDRVVTFLKREQHTIETAERDAGEIATALVITGGYSQTGTRIRVTLIKDSAAATTVRVAVTQQNRKKLLKTEPWSDPKTNTELSAAVADELRTAISVS